MPSSHTWGRAGTYAAGVPEVEDHYVPVTFENCAHVEGPFFHGTKVALAEGDELAPGYGSSYRTVESPTTSTSALCWSRLSGPLSCRQPWPEPGSGDASTWW